MNSLKRITLALVFFVANTSLAMPVMNLNAPGAEGITAYPDHMDPNLYYLAPTVMLVAQDEEGVPQFSYVEYDKKALVQMALAPQFDQEAIRKAKDSIAKINGQARFAGLPYQNSKLIFSDRILSDLIGNVDCNRSGGVVGSEQSCLVLLTKKGRNVLKHLFREGMTLTMQLEYTIDGVLQNVDGGYERATAAYQTAGRIGGPELACHPELFRDSKGRGIWRKEKRELEHCMTFEDTGPQEVTRVLRSLSDSPPFRNARPLMQNIDWAQAIQIN